MKLIKHGDNCHVLRFDNGVEVLFSYETPVAVALADLVGDGAVNYIGVYKTASRSKTTSRHINEWTNTSKMLPDNELIYLINLANNFVKVT